MKMRLDCSEEGDNTEAVDDEEVEEEEEDDGIEVGFDEAIKEEIEETGSEESVERSRGGQESWGGTK